MFCSKFLFLMIVMLKKYTKHSAALQHQIFIWAPSHANEGNVFSQYWVQFERSVSITLEEINFCFFSPPPLPPSIKIKKKTQPTHTNTVQGKQNDIDSSSFVSQQMD